MSTQIEKYKINGSGLLEGGNIEYKVDLDSGVVTCDGSVKVGVGFFAKTEPILASYTIPPSDLLSPAASAVGKVVDIGPAHMTVTHVDGNVATVSVVLDGLGTGTACLDISNQYLKLISMNANLKYSGVSVTASLQRT